jgi:hypothetical protein
MTGTTIVILDRNVRLEKRINRGAPGLLQLV